MKITISKKDFKKRKKEEKSGEKEMHHQKNASSQAKNFIRRNNTYKLEEKQKSHPKSNLTYLFYFLYIVFAAVLVAGIWRLFITFNSNSFTTSSFSILLSSEFEKKIVSVNAEDGVISLITGEIPLSVNRLKNAYSLGMPIDAVVKSSSTDPDDIFSMVKFISHTFKMSGVSYSDMTIFDFFRLASTYATVREKDRNHFVLETEDNSLGLSQEELFDAFKDPQIISEGLSIEIINATSENGLAGSAANILKPLGVNIVSLSSENEVEKSEIRVRAPSKTSKRISRILEIPISENGPNSIADVTVILGEDFAEKVR